MINKMRIPESTLTREKVLEENKRVHKLEDQFYLDRHPEQTNFYQARILKKTIETKEAHYWSRSRKKLWRKGQVSGFVQIVKEIRIDDDQDSLWLSVDIGNGASCHVGYRSCFYRSIPLGKIKNEEELEMEFKEKKKNFDPKKVYKDEPNPTKL